MLRFAICDDEPQIAEGLRKMIASVWEEEHRTDVFTNAEQLETYIRDYKGNIDILFLDIQLDRTDGVAVSRWVTAEFPYIKVIFITGYIEKSQYIFYGKPSGFLVKPIERNMLRDTIRRVAEALKQETFLELNLEQKQGIQRVPARDVRYIESVKHYLRIVTGDGEWQIREKLRELCGRLPSCFLQCHQSFCVNLNYVCRLSGNEFVLLDGTAIPISRNRNRESKEAFHRFLRETL